METAPVHIPTSSVFAAPAPAPKHTPLKVFVVICFLDDSHLTLVN